VVEVKKKTTNQRDEGAKRRTGTTTGVPFSEVDTRRTSLRRESNTRKSERMYTAPFRSTGEGKKKNFKSKLNLSERQTRSMHIKEKKTDEKNGNEKSRKIRNRSRRAPQGAKSKLKKDNQQEENGVV